MYTLKLKERNRQPDSIGTVTTIREAYHFARQYTATHAVEMQDAIYVYDDSGTMIDVLRLWNFC